MNKKTAVIIILTLALTVFLLYQIPLRDIPATLSGIKPVYWIGGFVLYAFSYFFRALRFRVLLRQRISLKGLFSIVCMNNMLNSLLPARTGELSYIYFINRNHGIALGKGIATLVVARILDFIIISGVFFISALFVTELPRVVSNTLTSIASVLILLMFLLILLVYRGQSLRNKIETALTKLRLNNWHPMVFLIQKGNEAAESFKAVQSRKVLLYSFVLSILIWSSNYIMTYILVSQIGINLPAWEIILGVTFIVFLALIPIPSVLGLGAHEGIWTLVFMTLGISKGLAISSGFGYHILIIVYYLVLGFYGLIAMRFKKTGS